MSTNLNKYTTMQALNEESILEDLPVPVKRRTLLPWWMRGFCILFMILGVISVFCIIISVFGFPAQLAIYGFEGNSAFSPGGAVAVGVFLLNGITAWALWFEKDFAIDLAMAGAIAQIMLCILSMAVIPYIFSDFERNLRLELILLVPYFIKLTKIKQRWKGTVVI